MWPLKQLVRSSTGRCFRLPHPCGNDGTFTHTYDGLENNGADNWILITTSNGEVMSSVSLDDTRFLHLDDLHVSGIAPPAALPEPASLALTGTGLAWLELRFRRKHPA